MRQAFSLTTAYYCTRLHNLPYNLLALPSVPLSWLLLNGTGLSANAVSWLAGLCGLAGVALFGAGYHAAAGIGLFLFFQLDCCDGTIARARGQVSPQGARLDLTVDRLVLFAFALTLMATNLLASQRLAAWLALGYLILHYVTDLMWLMSLQTQVRELDQPAPSAPPPPVRAEATRTLLARAFRGLLRLEGAVRPDAWVCNALFLLGPCLFPQARVWTAIVPLAALGWTLGVCLLYGVLSRR
jgi:phosphatidylglycerophosphate synthase